MVTVIATPRPLHTLTCYGTQMYKQQLVPRTVFIQQINEDAGLKDKAEVARVMQDSKM